MSEERRTTPPYALVVDPDEQFRRLLAGMLADVIEVVHVPDVQTAVTVAASRRPGMAVVDPLHLSRGLHDLVTALGPSGGAPRVPVLAVTGMTLRARELDRLHIDAVLPYRLLSKARLTRHVIRLCPSVLDPVPPRAVAVGLPR